MCMLNINCSWHCFLNENVFWTFFLEYNKIFYKISPQQTVKNLGLVSGKIPLLP